MVGSEGRGDGQFLEPTAAAVDSDGNLIVVDKEAAKVQKFTCSGECMYMYTYMYMSLCVARSLCLGDRGESLMRE